MKNFKKLLVTLLALVLLVSGAVVVSLAADTPAEIISDARYLLDQAMQEDGYIAVRSQKMRQLDNLITANLAKIRDSQEWRDFRVEYETAQLELKEDCLAYADSSIDVLMDKETSGAYAVELYNGLSALVAFNGDGRGYFDTESAEFLELRTRMLFAQAAVKLQSAEDSSISKEKGALLLWVQDYKAATLSGDEFAARPEITVIDDWFVEIYDLVKGVLFYEIDALAEEAMKSETSFARAIELADQIETYFTTCYFNQKEDSYIVTRARSRYARAFAYLNEIERSSDLYAQGKNLKALAELLASVSLSNDVEEYAIFYSRYNLMIDTASEDSILSRLYATAEGYKAQIAAVFTEDYEGDLDSKDDILDVVYELEKWVFDCYFPNKAYIEDAAIANAFAQIYDFYVVFGETLETQEEKIARNKYYRDAVTLYNSVAASIVAGSPAYGAAFQALYDGLTKKASDEINKIRTDWYKILNEAENKAEDGETYLYTLAQVKAAFNDMTKYFITASTALYYGDIDEKTIKAETTIALMKAENRMFTEFKANMVVAVGLVVIPETLSETDPVGLAARAEALDAVLADWDSVVLTQIVPELTAAFYHELTVHILLTKLCEVEVEYENGAEGSDAAGILYNELKAFAEERKNAIVAENADYIAYLALLNKTAVKIGSAYVSGTREYLDALIAIVDVDSFDKVYALMRLDEYIRQNEIVRPDASDTESPAAVMFAEYDVYAKKVKDWRQAKVDEREALVPLSSYSLSTMQFADMESKTLSWNKGSGHTFVSNDKTHHGANGSETYATLYYGSKGGDGYISAPVASKNQNFVFELDITTFTTFPSGGVSFNSGTNGLNNGARLYPWIGAFTGSGQLQVPNGNGNSRKTVTSREGGYIIPGQWTHLAIIYNAVEKTVSYYINDEKIEDENGKDTWSCTLADDYDFTEAIRIGHGNSNGSFSVDNVRCYTGNEIRDTELFDRMSDLQTFGFYVNYARNFIDNGIGSVADAKLACDTLRESINRYWGVPGGSSDDGSDSQPPAGDDGSGEELLGALLPLEDAGAGSTSKTPTYLFDEKTYWDSTADGYVDPGITYEEFKVVVDECNRLLSLYDEKIEGAMKLAVFEELEEKIAQLESLKGIENLNARKNLISTIESYIETNATYFSGLDDEKAALYASLLERKAGVEVEMEAYGRANSYIEMVNKLVAAKDLYSRTVYKAQAQSILDLMELDASLGRLDLDAIKEGAPKFVEAIATFEEQNLILDAQVIASNNGIIIDCMGRFPASAEDAIKEYDRLNKYIVLVRQVLAEGNYDANDADVKEALQVYNRMNAVFYEALQLEHAETLQELIDTFNSEGSYITRLGIFQAVKAYLEDNASVIDMEHGAILTILSQYEQMEEKFGDAEGLEKEWETYGEKLKSNAVKFVSIVTQMRFADSYAELGALREEAAKLFYYMDSGDADAKLAVEYYLACETILTQKALYGDRFIEAAYALSKATSMGEIYAAILVAKEAYALVDVTYQGSLAFTEIVNEASVTVEYTMTEAIAQYLIALSSYNSFVTVINNEVNTLLDVVCSVRADYAIHQTAVALFKKFYD